jgi:hypothetical protein
MKRRERLTVARSPVRNPARACRGGTPAMLRWPPMQMESWTVISETRGSRGCASRCRLRPRTFPRGGWSSAALWWLRVTVGDVDGLRNRTNRWCQEVRVNKWRRRVPEGGGGLTWSRRNRRWTATVLRFSDDESRRPGGTIGRGERGEGRGKRGLLIGAEIDGHYSRGISGEITPASFRFQREKRGNGGGDDADMRVPPVSEGREGGWVPLRVRLVGLWAGF